MLGSIETTNLGYRNKKLINGCLGLVVNCSDGLGGHKHTFGGMRKGLHFDLGVVYLNVCIC